MRTKEQFENEIYYGIQKFTSPSEAFKTIRGQWTDDNLACESNIVIMDDETFPHEIFCRAFLKYSEYKLGQITKYECDKALGKRADNITDYLLDFNFFLYSGLNGCFYTSRMEYKDDFVYMWNERQWDIYYELSQLYSFDKLVKDAQTFWKEHDFEISDMDDAQDILGWITYD